MVLEGKIVHYCCIHDLKSMVQKSWLSYGNIWEDSEERYYVRFQNW